MSPVVVLCALLGAPPEGGELALLKTFRDEFVTIRPGTAPFPAEATLGGEPAGAKTVKVRLPKSFAIAKYEVPQNLWEAVMGANPSRWKGPRNSVELLSFAEAQEFCKRATQRMREARLIETTQTVRLPSEGEWEYCARAGTTTRYSFGDDEKELGKFGWYTGNAAGNDPPVGAKAANPWGLHDMHGYLWEWCTDVWADDLADLPADGSPRTGGDEKIGVLRSGSWKDKADRLASGARMRAPRDLRDDAVGLRCVLAD